MYWILIASQENDFTHFCCYFLPAEVLQNNALPWEEKFCLLAGIPWHKVVAAKKYIYCHENVANWNDSAGKDALFNAKERFCAVIYDIPSDVPLPDPDMFIDNIDWNPKIDPGLMSDVDKEYYNPDEANISVRDQTSDGNNKNVGNDDNPWEAYRVQDTVDLKDIAQGWNRWGNSQKSKNVENLWEQSHLGGDGALKDNNWGSCGDNLLGWNKGLNNTRQSNNFDHHGGNLLNHGAQSSKFVKEKGWGDAGNNSCGWNHRNISFNESRNVYNNVNYWKSQPGETSKDRRWRDCGDNSWDSKQWGNQNNDFENFDSRRSGRGGRGLSGGCRKREGSLQHTPRRKSWKLEGDGSGARQF